MHKYPPALFLPPSAGFGPSRQACFPSDELSLENAFFAPAPFLFKSVDFDNIHITKRLVISDHSPYKTIVRDTGAGVNRPTWRDHSFFVSYHDMASTFRFSHQMKQDSIRFQIVIEVNFHSTSMSMARRHAVPNITSFEDARHKPFTFSPS